MLEGLRQLWRRVGRLSGDLINKEKGIPSAHAFLNHFGTLNNAYSLIGYRPDLKNKYDASIARHKMTRRNLFDDTRAKLQSSGASIERVWHLQAFFSSMGKSRFAQGFAIAETLRRAVTAGRFVLNQCDAT